MLARNRGRLTRIDEAILDLPQPAPSSASRPTAGDRVDESKIAAAMATGDRRAALELLMSAYGAAVLALCRRMLGDSDRVRDVRQLVFVEAHDALLRFEGKSSYRTWLLSIARHRCLDAIKSIRRGRVHLVETSHEPSDAEKNPEQRSLEVELRRILEQCLQQLKPTARTAVLLRFQQKLTYPQMSEIEGELPATLQARVSRALPALRQCIERHGGSL